MKAIIAAAGLVAAAAPAALAQSEADFPYASFSAGWYHPLSEGTGNLETTVNRDDGPTLHVALGHKYRDFRAEAEVGWAYGGVGSHGGSNTASLMINAYYDLDTGTPVVPFVGVGAGMAYIDFDGVTVPGLGSFKDYDVDLAWQGILGLGYKLEDDLVLFGAYRFFDASNVKMHTESGTRVKLDGFGSHNVEIGIRYHL